MDMVLLDDVQILAGRPITQQVLSEFLTALLMQGSKVALAHSGLLSDISVFVPTSQNALVLEIIPPTTEEMVAILLEKLAARYPRVSLNTVEAASIYAAGDIGVPKEDLTQLFCRANSVNDLSLGE